METAASLALEKVKQGLLLSFVICEQISDILTANSLGLSCHRDVSDVSWR